MIKLILTLYPTINYWYSTNQSTPKTMQSLLSSALLPRLFINCLHHRLGKPKLRKSARFAQKKLRKVFLCCYYCKLFSIEVDSSLSISCCPQSSLCDGLNFNPLHLTLLARWLQYDCGTSRKISDCFSHSWSFFVRSSADNHEKVSPNFEHHSNHQSVRPTFSRDFTRPFSEVT